ncbi:telomere repeat binding factor-domain-containing protein [Apodospora peruviana]|uniref:Telomere repeat binding factor-domain-containing protein n=1 Tax=Apodospora peruviana TaxID=516989 RepID=A0AAE0M0L5_9PEZI|nr:telomere repeat binding factor-domain-containing protein [Apodospora peruviana]
MPPTTEPDVPQPTQEPQAVEETQTDHDHDLFSAHANDDLLASLQAAVSQPPPVTYAVPAQEAGHPSSPKRARSPDLFDLDNGKRAKTDHTGDGGQAADEPHDDIAGFDMAAMLENALGSFDGHFGLHEAPTGTGNAHEVRPHSSTTATPGPEKVENRFMKASSNSTYVMRSMSLPVLGNIAVQILLRLSQQSRADTELLLSDTDSEFRRAYDILRDIFGPARKVFSESPLLFPDELDISDSEDRETIRMSNLAATAVSVFGTHEVALKDIHDSFFSIFVQEDAEIKEPLTDLLISLKTRLFIDALGEQTEGQQISELLDKIFAATMEESLKQRSGDVALNSDEERLVTMVNERREILARPGVDEDHKESLASQFSSNDFAQNLSTFLQSHLGIVVEYAEKYGVNIPLSEEPVQTENAQHHHQDEHVDLAALIQSEISQHNVSKEIHSDEIMAEAPLSLSEGLDLGKLLEQSLASHIPEQKDGLLEQLEQHDPNDHSDMFSQKDLAALISEKLGSDGLDSLAHGLPNIDTPSHSHDVHATNNALANQYMAQVNQTHSSPYTSYTQAAAPAAPAPGGEDTLPPNQSSPTSVLYERARQAAVAKSSSTTRREGLHSTRRPWTPEEEKALMAGLDMVKGPHWSQILSLFGPSGTISDILKDRTQVQLKDKARNLKLFFLKTNSEMPYYLQSVTGELKTRAPSQAARKEAEEKARLNSEEEKARIQGIMTLASFENNHHPIASSPLAASPSVRASPIVPGARGTGTTAPTSTTHAPTTSVPALAPMPISPLVKTEPVDRHQPSHGSTLPHIQPAPAPQHPAYKSHTGPIHHPQTQQKPQAKQQTQSQASPPPHQQQPQPQKHQQQQPQQQHQQQSQQPQQPQCLQAPQSQTSHSQAPPPLLPTSPPQHQTQSHPPPAAPTNHHNNHQNFALPPMPPNHHSTPDHQDTKLFETLQAAIAATPSTVSETQAG